MTWLELGRNQITDLKPLAELKGLHLLVLVENQITDLMPLAGLTKLRGGPFGGLYLFDNPNLTRTEIDKLQKALPWCRIRHNAKK